MSCHLDPFDRLRVNSGRDLLGACNTKISHDLRNDISIKLLGTHDTRGRNRSKKYAERYWWDIS
jgi:hypothetical protein